MSHYKQFALDEWIRSHRPLSKITLHDSCVDPLSLAELQEYDPKLPPLDLDAPTTYAPYQGLQQLRKAIASLYSSGIHEDDILVTGGAISANYNVLSNLVAPGDHAIIQYPTYGQLTEVTRRAGAEVSYWKQSLSANEHRWTLDIAELKLLIRSNTRVLILNNPSNPTGLALDGEQLLDIVNVAWTQNIVVVCDEVFRFLHHDPTMEQPPSILDLGYDHAVAIGSLSKAFALPGIRVGWIATTNALAGRLMPRFQTTSDYTVISVSRVDQQIACFALQPHVRSQILLRSRHITARNIEVLRSWARSNSHWVEFTPPQGAGTCLIKIKTQSGTYLDDQEFAKALTLREGVCLPPAGSCFGFEADGSGGTDLDGYFRVGIVSKEEILAEGLLAIERLRSTWEG